MQRAQPRQRHPHRCLIINRRAFALRCLRSVSQKPAKLAFGSPNAYFIEGPMLTSGRLGVFLASLLCDKKAQAKTDKQAKQRGHNPATGLFRD